MADSLPMAQIPQFSLGATPNPNPAAPAIQGASIAGQDFLGIRQNQIAQQQANQQGALAKSQIQQQQIQQVDSLLKTGLSYPGLLPSFWPTIATKMNQISPDYKLDPNNPPENLTTFSKQLSDISDGVQDKVVTLPQAHTAVSQLIGQTFPSVQDALSSQPDAGGGVASGPNQNMSVQPSQGQPQATPQQGGIQQDSTQPPSNPLADFASLKGQYDKANAFIASAPPDRQEDLRKQLENSSLGQNYRKSLDMLATHANAQFTEGQQNDRNQFNQKQDNLRAAASSFPTQSQEFKNVSDNFSAFNHLMQMSSQMESQGADTTARVQAEKTALLNFAQMAYPGTGRPGNQEMLETMEKSGPVGTLIGQSLNRLDKGDVMTESQIKGLRQTALTLYQGREVQQSQLEDGYAKNIEANGGEPMAFIKDLRPQSAASTSKLFPRHTSDRDPAIGHVVTRGKTKYQYLGGDKTKKENWVTLDSDE